MHQNLLYDSPAAARAASRGTLALHACRDCDFVFNAAFDDALTRLRPHQTETPEDAAFRKQILDAISSLPDDERKVVMMLAQGIPVTSDDPTDMTITKLLDCSDRTVRNKRTSAAKKLARFHRGESP